MTNNHTSSVLFFILMVSQISAVTALKRTTQQACLEFKMGQCVNCHANYHLHNHKCHQNIPGCMRYVDRDDNSHDCAQCNIGYLILRSTGRCLATTADKQFNSTRILEQENSNICGVNDSCQHSDDLKNNAYFQLVNSYMLHGNYKHFITQSPTYIKSIRVDYDDLEANFKIIYYGGGGGLMLCIISINIVTKAIQLRSFVAIDAAKLVENCLTYQPNTKCSSCQEGFHLQNGLCYRSIENCLKHVRNICIECRQYSLLIENRCVTGCRQTMDTNKIRLYGDVRIASNSILPVIEQSYLL